MKTRPKLTLLVNIIAPYRLPVYQELARHFDLSIFIAGNEGNRDTWQKIEEKLTGISVRESWGLTVGYTKKKSGKVFNKRYFHITPGYFYDLLRTSPDAIITNEMGVRTFIALLYGTIFTKPVWVWWGGTLHTEKGIGLTKKIVRSIIARWADHWLSYGETSTEYLQSLGVARDRIVQIQNCVDERLFLTPVEPLLDVQPKPVFLHVGQLLGRKGVNALLKAAAVLQGEGRVFSLLLVGSGVEKESLENYARELKLSNVTFHPPQSPDAMPAVYRSADFLVFPTLEDTWGLVVNEALWSGEPVISSIYAGCSQEIVPPENRFDPLDMDDFVGVLRRALDGKIAPPDVSMLKTAQEVAGMIINDINRGIAG